MSCTVRVSKLSGSWIKRAKLGNDDGTTPRELLRDAAVPFGFSGKVVVLQAARAALLEMDSADSAARMVAHHAALPLELGGRTVVVGFGKEGTKSPGERAVWNEKRGLAECERCLSSLTDELERREGRAGHHHAVARAQLATSPTTSVRILTVGDGDLGYSLGLARALGCKSETGVEVVASTLVSADELIRCYSRARAHLAELKERGVVVLHGVDATRLEESLTDQDGSHLFDHICFNYPHLGDEEQNSSGGDTISLFARQHAILIAHFLESARAMLRPGGLLHVTLSHDQPAEWKVAEHAARLGLGLLSAAPPTSIQATHFPSHSACPASSQWAARRRYRNGALGGKHWLGKYGYEHRRCESDRAMNVQDSVELVYQASKPQEGNGDAPAQPGAGRFHSCHVCGFNFTSVEELALHVEALSTGLHIDQGTAQCGGAAPVNPSKLEGAGGRRPECSDAEAGDDERAQVGGAADAVHGDLGTEGLPILLRNVEIDLVLPDIAVVWKPVGVRSCGAFAGTLQTGLLTLLPPNSIANERGSVFAPIPMTMLEKGCAGLSLVARTPAGRKALERSVAEEDMQHTFVALVHGRVEWQTGHSLEMLIDASRAGKAAAAPAAAPAPAAASQPPQTAAPPGISCPRSWVPVPVRIEVVSSFMAPEDLQHGAHDDGGFALSTIRLSCGSLRGHLSGALCHLLRKHGHPVVGDSYARRECSRMPRCCISLRKKLQIGCYGVRVELGAGIGVVDVSRPMPDRLDSKTWGERMAQRAAPVDTEDIQLDCWWNDESG